MDPHLESTKNNTEAMPPDETPKAKKQRLPDEMGAVSEETEAPGKSVEKGSAMTKVLALEAFFQTCDEPYRFLLHDWRCDRMPRAARQAAKQAARQTVRALASSERSAGGPWRHRCKVRDEKDLVTTCHMQSTCMNPQTSESQC